MITVTGLAKYFKGETARVHAIDGVDFTVPNGEFLTLLGPSGCGKTTTLRCLAGLEQPDQGEISIKGRTVVDVAKGVLVPVHSRRIGMVFQSYAIWPHMTVLQNVCYPLLERGVSRRERQRRGEEALDLVGLGGLGKRFAPNLSGGQQQRVALARALVAEPEVLLLDEPLSNLDAKLRDTMRVELRSLQQRLGITTLYVTHDQNEALSMSDVVVVMKRGRIMETGTPRELYERPRTRFVANFLGTTNLLDSCPHGCAKTSDVSGSADVKRSIRPEDITISPTAPSSGVPAWEGVVTKAVFLGSHTHCEVVTRETTLKVHVHHSQPVNVNDRVVITWDVAYCDAVTGLVNDDVNSELEFVKDR